MKPHPTPHRIRKTIKWGKYGGAVVTVLLVVVWIGSVWTAVEWRGHHSVEVDLAEGSIEVTRWSSPGQAGGWKIHAIRNPRMELEPTLGNAFWGSSIGIPLWIPIVACLIATVTAWRLDMLARRRAGLNHCPKCTYDRAGIAADAKCPECGSGGGASA